MEDAVVENKTLSYSKLMRGKPVHSFFRILVLCAAWISEASALDNKATATHDNIMVIHNAASQ